MSDLMDKPKTLHEQLNKVATAIEGIFGYYDVNGVYHKAKECADLAAEVRALAEQVRGRVLAPLNDEQKG